MATQDSTEHERSAEARLKWLLTDAWEQVEKYCVVKHRGRIMNNRLKLGQVRADRRMARYIIKESLKFWPEPEPGTTITEDEACEKITGLLMLAGARRGLIRVVHWPEEGESLEDMRFDENSLRAFWERYGHHIQAIYNSM